MALSRRNGVVEFRSDRLHPGARRAYFEASWSREGPIHQTEEGTLGSFPAERYCLYSLQFGRLLRVSFRHIRWPIQEGRLIRFRSTVIEAAWLPAPRGEPYLQFQAEPVEVDVFRAKVVGASGK